MRSAMSKMITKRGADSNSNCQEVDTKTDTKTVEMSVICLEPVWKLRGALFSGKRPDGATKENIPGGSSTEEQRSQTAFSPKTLRAAGLLSVAGVGSFLTARCGDARNSPPWPQPKSLAAAPLVVSKQALSVAASPGLARVMCIRGTVAYRRQR